MEHAKTIAKMKAWCLENYENGAYMMVELWENGNYEYLIELCDGNLEDAWSNLKALAGIYD